MTTAPSGRTRLHPETRREQLLELGVRLLSTRSLDELSIDVLAEEAGISRGLLYHYFGNKQDFHRAVVRHAADDLIRVTAPVQEGEPLERLARSLDAYVGYVEANYAGYVSLVRGAASGNEDLQRIYEEARAALTDRIFDVAGAEGVLDVLHLEDTPAGPADGAGLERDGRGRGDRLGARAGRGRPRGPADDARRRAARGAVRGSLTRDRATDPRRPP